MEPTKDQQDYLAVLAETGFSQEKVLAITENTADQTDMPEEFGYLSVAESPIAGKGLFTSKDISEGDLVGIARIGGNRTALGRYVNHSANPNAEYQQLDNGDLAVIAIREIPAGTEITYNYRTGAIIRGDLNPVTAYFCKLITEKTGLLITTETPALEIRKMICTFEALMRTAVSDGEIIDSNPDYVIKNHFASGVYAREMHIPAGHIVVGKIHRNENLHFLSKGSATVITEEGGIEVVHAGQMMKSPVGVKRLLITHEDVVWTVLHATTETDVDKIELAVIAKSYADLGYDKLIGE